MTKKSSNQTHSNLRAWLNIILRNTFFSDIRKQREIEGIDGSPTAALTLPPPQEHAVALAELLKEMAFLPPPQREALILVGGAGSSIAKAAAQLGCANGTVKSGVSRARTNHSARLMPMHYHNSRQESGSHGAHHLGPDHELGLHESINSGR